MRALAHPTRLQMLSLLTGAQLSAAELARELDIAHAAASYHLKQLRKAGLIDVAEQRSVRGGTEILFAPVADEIEGLASDEGSNRIVAQAMAAELVRRSALSTDPKALRADAQLWIEPEIWDLTRQRLREILEELHAHAAPVNAPGTIHVSATVAAFEIDSTKTKPDET